MNYHGKLYGKLWDKYFDTSHTTDEWDAMERQIAELKAENEALKQINHICECEEKSINHIGPFYKECGKCGKQIK